MAYSNTFDILDLLASLKRKKIVVNTVYRYQDRALLEKYFSKDEIRGIKYRPNPHLENLNTYPGIGYTAISPYNTFLKLTPSMGSYINFKRD